MTMTDILTAISTVGFPIVACAALAFFIYKFTTEMQTSARNREEELLKIIGEQGESLRQIADVLDSISDRLERVENALDSEE